MEKSIAFFDFDGTITSKDTMLELAKFSCSNSLSYIAGLCAVSPWVVAMKLGIISKSAAKEKLLTLFFKGKTATAFSEICAAFKRNGFTAVD